MVTGTDVLPRNEKESNFPVKETETEKD